MLRLDLSAIPNNTAKLRLILDLASELNDAEHRAPLRILDVGVGGQYEPFNVWLPFLPLKERIELVGADVANLSATETAAARAGFPVTLITCPAGELVSTFGSASFDAVVSTQVLERLPRWRRDFAQLARVLRPNGGLFITCDSGDARHALPHKLRLRVKCLAHPVLARVPPVRRLSGLSGGWERAPRLAALQRAADCNGLRVECLRHYGTPDLKRLGRSLDSTGRLRLLEIEEATPTIDSERALLLYLRARRIE